MKHSKQRTIFAMMTLAVMAFAPAAMAGEGGRFRLPEPIRLAHDAAGAFEGSPRPYGSRSSPSQ